MNYVNCLIVIICFLYPSNSHLPDDPAVRWREDIVANLLLNHIEALSIDTVSNVHKFLYKLKKQI